MNKLCRNHKHTLCHPEAAAEGSGHKSTMSSRFFTAFRMTFSPLSSSDLSLPHLSSSGLTAGVLACLLLTTPTQAKWGDNCTLNGGTIIKANEYGNDKGGYCNDPNNPDLTNNCNGMEFCVSNKTMNWWSAFTWCESVGGKLASFEHMCPGSQMVEGACPNLTKVGDTTVYSNAGWSTTLAMLVTLSDGRVWNGWSPISRRGSAMALCEK